MDYKEEGRRKTQKEDWQALARDKKESRSVIAQAKKKHVEELKGITCTEELNKGIKKACRRSIRPGGFRCQQRLARAGLEAPG